MQYEYKVFTEGNYDNKDIIENKLNELLFKLRMEQIKEQI